MATEMTVTLRLSDQTQAKLEKQAANSGQVLSAVASALIEEVVNRRSIAQIMAPVHEDVAKSGLSDTDIDGLLRNELDVHRREKRTKSS